MAYMIWAGSGISQDRASIPVTLTRYQSKTTGPFYFKPRKSTPYFNSRWNHFLPGLLLSSKKSYFDFFFFTYKLGRGRPISKVSQTLKNVNQDPQGCPTIPHDHPMYLYHPVGAYLCVLSTTIFPYKSRKSKKKSTSVTPTSEKTSDSAFSSKVCSTKVKLEIRNSKN